MYYLFIVLRFVFPVAVGLDAPTLDNLQDHQEQDFAQFEQQGVTPRSKKEGTKPPFVCPRCSNHTYSNNMITRFHVQ
jgi:hypothetical protein